MKYSIIAFTFLSTVAVLTARPAPLYAQSSESDDYMVIEEVTVTARRREESLRDVPGTVTAFTKQNLQSAGVQRAADFIRLTPGVTIVDAAEVADTQVNIRGINGARDAENSFAYIIDGILLTNPAAVNREYTDLQQIEVFKGPQGAIYGRNAAAGAIIVTTTDLSDVWEVHGVVSAAQDSSYLAKVSTSGPLGDNWKLRISGDWRETDGFYRNQFQNNDPIVDNLESYNLNGRLIWEPNEDLTLDMKLRLGRVDASSITFNSTFNLPVFAELFPSPPAYQDVNDYDFQFDANIISDNDQDATEFSTKLDYAMDGMNFTGWFLYSDIENNLMSDGTSAGFGFYQFETVCKDTTLALAGYPVLPPQFINISPGSVIFDPANGSFLGAYTPTTCDGIQEQIRNQKDYSLELRLSSDTDNKLQWMAGIYLLDIDREVGVSLNKDSGSTPIRGLYQPEPGPNSTASLTHDQFDSKVWALFGQIEYDVNDDLELSFALRYDKEKREVSSLVPFDARQSFVEIDAPFFDGIINDPLNPALSNLVNTTGVIPDKEETFSELQPKVALRWDATASTSIYGSWGVGFKAGGFNNSGSADTVGIFINGFINCGSPTGICYADELGVPLPVINDDFDKETSSAFEVGFNSFLLDGRLRLNGAAYYTEVTDMQFFEFFVGTFGLLRVVSNIDKVEISGLELGGDWVVNENWRFYAGVNFLDTEIKENSSRPDTVGNPAPYTPDFTGNLGGEFRYPISDSLSIFARVDARWVGETWFHTVQEGERPTIFMPLFDMGFGFAPFGIAEYSIARRDEYSLVDLRLGIGGDKWTLTGFAMNLTDEKYIEEAIPAPEFGGVFSHPGTQRRYGVELSFRY